MAAARALGVVKPEGLEEDALRLASGDLPNQRIDHLVAVALLARHSGPQTEELLIRLAVDREPTVTSIALRRLLDLDPRLVQPINSQIVASKDANVRQVAAEIFRGQRTPAAISLLGMLLDDVEPGVRKYAQESLIALAEIGELRSSVHEAAVKALATDHPRALEQATLVVGGIDHKPAANRLLELLEHKVPAVSITAAWALRRLSVPETAGPIFEKVKTDTEKSMVPLPLDAQVDWSAVSVMYKQQEHLLEALGLMRYRKAESLLLLYLPTPPRRGMSPPDIRLDTVWVHELRVRAIWALGHVFANEPKPIVVASLRDRLSNGDSGLIRAMAAVSLGRMHAQESLELLRSYYRPQDEYDILRYGCAWGVEQITGEPTPEFTFKPEPRGRTGWFLESLD